MVQTECMIDVSMYLLHGNKIISLPLSLSLSNDLTAIPDTKPSYSRMPIRSIDFWFYQSWVFIYILSWFIFKRKWWRLFSLRMLLIDFYEKQIVTKESLGSLPKLKDVVSTASSAEYKPGLQSVYTSPKTRCLRVCNQANWDNHIIAHMRDRWYVKTIIWTHNFCLEKQRKSG